MPLWESGQRSVAQLKEGGSHLCPLPAAGPPPTTAASPKPSRPRLLPAQGAEPAPEGPYGRRPGPPVAGPPLRGGRRMGRTPGQAPAHTPARQAAAGGPAPVGRRRRAEPRRATHQGADGSNCRRAGAGGGVEVRAPPSPSLPLIPLPPLRQAASPRQPASAPPRRPRPPPRWRPLRCLTARRHTAEPFGPPPAAREVWRSCGSGEGDIEPYCPRNRGSAAGRAVPLSRRRLGS